MNKTKVLILNDLELLELLEQTTAIKLQVKVQKVTNITNCKQTYAN